MTRWLLLLALAACYEPRGGHCAINCGAASACPDGLECDTATNRCALPNQTCSGAIADADVDDDAPPDDGDTVDAPGDGPEDAVVAACPANYVAITETGTSTKYRTVAAATGWFDAAAACAADDPNNGLHTHLAVLNSAMERTGLQAAFPSTQFWIGLSDARVPGFDWVTDENVAVPMAPGNGWQSGQPDNAQFHDCVLVNGSGAMADDICGASLGYICECDAFANDPTNYL